jgi:PRTRC genetic system protein A
MSLIDYHFAFPGRPLPPVDEHKMLDYVAAANGVYARGRRPGLEVCMPVSFNLQGIRGLVPIASYAQWGFPKVTADVLLNVLRISKHQCRREPKEALFYFRFDGGWRAEYPKQTATADTVIADESVDSSNVIIELHSHHSMAAEFSHTDNADESQGFRVYAVIGRIFDRPTINARIGLWGHFFPYPASEFFDMPDELADAIAA